MSRRQAMLRWHSEALPLIERLIKAQDDLVSVSEEPAVVVGAARDQLDAAIRHAQLWRQSHRCPDVEFDMWFGELISAGFGLCAVMQMVSNEAPEGQWIGNHDLVEKVATNLLDRIQQASNARTYLRQWSA